jgi:hypothetical protein
MRETRDHPLDENGVYNLDDIDHTIEMGVYCLSCGARHVYDNLHESSGRYTIALEANSDPEPVATVAVAFRGSDIVGLEADRLVGLIAVDEDRREVGRFLARCAAGGEWERLKKLTALIPKGEYKASFKEVEDGESQDD